MRNLYKSLFGLCVVGIALAMSAPSSAVTSAIGPYYATPSWDQTLPVATRFIVLTNMNSEAVLDRETGLVWERSPTTSRFEWFGAQSYCLQLNAGGRTGWRVPGIQELMSLVDQSVSPGPTLPSGHPFAVVVTGGGNTFYWSATLSAQSPPGGAWAVNFDIGRGNLFTSTNNSVFVWCVRGGQGVDAQ